jgi:putative glutamine amidotransferase
VSKAPPPRPVIGLNCDFVNAGKHGPAAVRLHAGYFDAILAAGGLPVILPPFTKQPDVDALLDRIDGVLLVGGADMDPRRQNLPTHPSVQPMAARREEADRILVKRAIDRRLPIMGVGLGLQQINAALGGSLYLHLPEEQPKAMPHYDPTGGPHRHTVMLEPKTRLDDVYGGGELRVNSSHHQAVKQLGNGLRAAALAPDGVIEAVESTDPDWFCVGVQWHPESDTASALDMQLFECFVQAALAGENTRSLSLAA